MDIRCFGQEMSQDHSNQIMQINGAELPKSMSFRHNDSAPKKYHVSRKNNFVKHRELRRSESGWTGQIERISPAMTVPEL